VEIAHAGLTLSLNSVSVFTDDSQRPLKMGINLVVAVTDDNWFEMLRRQPELAEVNFWAPSAANFRALHPGELFLFKLHSPRNAIVGGGIFAFANTLPWSLAWEAFREANGARSALQMRARIARYRRTDPSDRSDFQIGCRILTQPFFFEERDWIPVPPSWSANIVSFKTYNTDDAEGLALWKAVNERLNQLPMPGHVREPAGALWRAAPHPPTSWPGCISSCSN
jgi:putative restriction endonuclease